MLELVESLKSYNSEIENPNSEITKYPTISPLYPKPQAIELVESF
jgi:hypothetical protein